MAPELAPLYQGGNEDVASSGGVPAPRGWAQMPREPHAAAEPRESMEDKSGEGAEVSRVTAHLLNVLKSPSEKFRSFPVPGSKVLSHHLLALG